MVKELAARGHVFYRKIYGLFFFTVHCKFEFFSANERKPRSACGNSLFFFWGGGGGGGGGGRGRRGCRPPLLNNTLDMSEIFFKRPEKTEKK